MRRNPDDWTQKDNRTSWIVNRGYTGHEHLDVFGIINMNGRVYDPATAPLSLFDPSGYSWLSDNWRSLLGAAIGIGVSIATAGLLTPVGVSLSTLAIGTQVTIAVVAGAAGGFAGGVAGTLLNGGSVGDALKAGIIGGAIGAASGFLNYAAGCASFTGIGATIERAAKHAFVDVWMGGVRNAVYGGELSPIRDAIGGALSSMGNDVMGDNLPQNIVIQTTSAAILGGTISEIGGGKFANGAVTGAYSMLFNKLMHDSKEQKLNKLIRKYKEYDDLALAYSIVGTALIESTTNGELLTNIREVIESYDTNDDKSTQYMRELYSKTVDILKDLNSDGKYDYGYSIMSLGCYGQATIYSTKADYYVKRIYFLDKTYYKLHIEIDSSYWKTGGGGANGGW